MSDLTSLLEITLAGSSLQRQAMQCGHAVHLCVYELHLPVAYTVGVV